MIRTRTLRGRYVSREHSLIGLRLGLVAINCPKQRTESKGRGKPPFWRPVTTGNSDTPLKQLQVAQKAEAQTSSAAKDLLSLFLSNSVEKQVNL